MGHKYLILQPNGPTVKPLAALSISATPCRPSSRAPPQVVILFHVRAPSGLSSVIIPSIYSASEAEKSLRLAFMEELMTRARDGDVSGVSDVVYDMIAAGMTPGPRSFHGWSPEQWTATWRAFLSQMQMNSRRRELSAEEMVRNKHLEDANALFIKGAKSGLRATDELYDLIIEEDCKVGDHSNVIEIFYEMEAAGWFVLPSALGSPSYHWGLCNDTASGNKCPFAFCFLEILQTAHAPGYTFGSPVYDEIISLCLGLGELDAAVAIAAEMESSRITVPDQSLDRVISTKKTVTDEDAFGREG
ncbi:hypothetical protein MLD38_017905 [Melastoma candidum]|uniref:Uncharacterized protein n=1 Tax=Melastoma candidum TaxID=119954 RepID=A0ACB9QW76_9MYRT|nr:hypothetical protein MLD38_017905 [Melastoma candidum]